MSRISVHFPSVILDEICLEGLDGITLQGLWLRLENRFEYKISEILRNKFWKIATNLCDVDFYVLPEPRADLIIVNRFSKLNGKYLVQDVEEDDIHCSIYPHYAVDKDYGSCQHYSTRVKVNDEVKEMSLQNAEERWGNHLVLVGTVQARWHALAPGSPQLFEELSKAQYCILESIGRSRENGETTWKMMSTRSEIEDPKTLFYHRKKLVSYNLVVTKPLCIRTPSNINSIILHLSRFAFPFTSKEEFVIQEIKNEILSSPTNMLPLDRARQIIEANLKYNVSLKGFLKMSEVSKRIMCAKVNYKDFHPNASPEECINKNNGLPKELKVIKLNEGRKNMVTPNDYDEEDDTVDQDVPGFCFVGENLLYQAYSCVHDAGPGGITRLQLSKKLGVDILTARSLLRKLRFRDNLMTVLTEEKRQKKELFICPDFVKLRNAEFEVEMKRMEDNSIKMKEDDVELTAIQPVQQTEKKSLKNLRLTNLVLEQVRYRHIIHECQNLVKYCDRKQLALGANTGIVDRRTIIRIVTDLESQGLVCCHRIKLEPKYNSKLLTFICEPNITVDHPYILSVVEQTKLAVNTVSKGRKAQRLNVKSVTKPKLTCSTSNKFVKTCLIHKFLFYILYGHENKVVEDVLTYSQYDSKFNDLLVGELSPVYEDSPDDFIFVPPVTRYEDLPLGWFVLADILLCMPLYLYTRVISLPTFPLLDEYLKHPLKRQILLKNTPQEIQNLILWKKYNIYPIIERLCYFGLVKFGQRCRKEKFKINVYLNKVGNILDTRTSEPSYFLVEDKPYNPEYFTFDSLDDVHNYWSRLQVVCLNTILGIPTSMIGKEITILSPERKLSEYLRSFAINEAIELDIGQVPGDRRGAGGIDSSIYPHLKRSWGINNDFGVKPVMEPPGMSKKALKLIRKKPKLSRNVQMITANTVTPAAKGKIIKRTIMPRKKKRVRKSDYDEEDKIAMKNMTTLRAFWNSKEDRIIVLTAVAHSILGIPKFLFATMTREMLFRTTHVRNKTTFACRRRVLFLMKKKSVYRNIEIHISEIKQNPIAMEQYSHLYKRLLVKKNEDYENFEKEIQIHFIEFIQYLHRMIYNKETINEYLALPKTLSEFYAKYSLYSSEIAVVDNCMEPMTIEDITQSKVQSLIHLTLSSESKANQSKRSDALKVFKQFSEELLRMAVQKINSLGMVVKHKKIRQKTSQLSSAYGLSQMYMYHLCSPTPYSTFPELYNNYKSIAKSKNISCENIDSGLTALLTDLNSLNAIEFQLTIPENILIQNPKLLDADDETMDANNQIMEALNAKPMHSATMQMIEGSLGPMQDAVVVNSCQLDIVLHADMKTYLDIAVEVVSELLDKWNRDAVFEYDKKKVGDLSQFFNTPRELELAKEIYKFINSKEWTGANSEDIINQFLRKDKLTLQSILLTLKDAKLIFRVGVKKLKWISVKHFKTWFIKIKEASKSDFLHNLKRPYDEEYFKVSKRIKLSDDECSTSSASASLHVKQEEKLDIGSNSKCEIFICGRVWMKLNGTLNYRNLWRWLGAILCYLVSHPVASMDTLCKRFNFLFPFHIYLLIEMLEDMKCIKILVRTKSQTTLWDDGSDLTFSKATILDEYSQLYIFIEENALGKFAYYRGVAIDLKKSQDSTFSLEEVSQTITESDSQIREESTPVDLEDDMENIMNNIL